MFEELKARMKEREEGRKLYKEVFEKEFKEKKEQAIRETARKRAREQAKQSATRYGRGSFGLSFPKEERETAKRMMGNFAASLEQNPFGSGRPGKDQFGFGGFGEPAKKRIRRKHKHKVSSSKSGR